MLTKPNPLKRVPRGTSKVSGTESLLLNQLMRWLFEQGALPIRVNSGAAKVGRRWVRFNSQPGCSDILCCWHGRLVAIEAKSPTGRQRPDQAKFEASVQAAGGRYILCTSLEGAKKCLIP